MKTPYRVPTLGLAALFTLAWISLAAPAAAQEPKTTGSPTVTKNPDGGTTETEPVDFGKKGELHTDDHGQVITDPPFLGKGTKRTTRDKDGKVTKVEWVNSKGKVRRAVYFKDEGNIKVITRYDYEVTLPSSELRPEVTLPPGVNPPFPREPPRPAKGDDGRYVKKNEKTFSRSDGKKMSDETDVEKPNGDVVSGDRWKSGDDRTQIWDPKTGSWVDSARPPPEDPKADLNGELKRYGAEDQPPGQSSAGQATPPTVAGLLAAGRIKIDISGTGETIGHVATAAIQNLTDQPVKFKFPAMILESKSGKKQNYGLRNGPEVALKPRQLINVPLDGVCLNRNKPPVGNGVADELTMNTGDPNDPGDEGKKIANGEVAKLLRLTNAKYRAVDKLIEDPDALTGFPYKDKKKQHDILVQWSTWSDPEICQMTGSPPATKKDLQKAVYKQVEANGPMTPETKKKVDQGIDTIYEKVELANSKAKDLDESETAENEEETPQIGTGGINISNDTPTPAPGTQERPKKDKKKKKKGYIHNYDDWWNNFVKQFPFADWLEKKFRAGWADDAKNYRQDDYNAKFHDWVNQKKNYTDLKNQRDAAEQKAKAPGATDADKDAFNKLDNQLKKLENDFKGDFNRTDDGKKAMGDLREAEVKADEAHAAERDASKNIDDATKEAVDNYFKDNPPPPGLIHPPNPIEALW